MAWGIRSRPRASPEPTQSSRPEFWAFVRQTGIPTASPDALDADAIPAGQATLADQPGDIVTIATNLARLNRFPGIDAQMWDRIQ